MTRPAVGSWVVHVGIAAAIAAAAVTAVDLVQSVGAGSGTQSSFVPITPCRLADTRVQTPVGTRATPIGAGETVTLQVTGSNGQCILPADATGIASNVTVVNPTAASYLTVFPADAAQPLASNLNWTAASSATPNQVTVALSATGAVKVFNNAGTIDVVVDIVGYYVSAPPPITPARVLWVATNGSHPASPGGSVAVFALPSEALASITDNSAASRYVIDIAPGTYTEPAAISLKPFVDLAGSGRGTTTIACACGGSSPTDGSEATLRANGTGGLIAEVRDVTITNLGGGPNTEAVWMTHTSASLVLTRVAATVGAGTGNNYAIYNYNNSSPTMTDVSATANGGTSSYAIYNDQNSSPVMTNITATAATTGAVSTSVGICNNQNSSPSMTDITATASGATTNEGVCNQQNSSPRIANLSASATGGTNDYGMYGTLFSSPTITDSTLTASGGANGNVGFYNSSGTVTLNTVTSTGTGGVQARGIANVGSGSLTLVNVTATGSGGSTNQDWGLDDFNTSTATVRDSYISGTPNSILNNSTGVIYVANTRLNHPAAGGGTRVCINAYSDAFVLLAANCT